MKNRQHKLAVSHFEIGYYDLKLDVLQKITEVRRRTSLLLVLETAGLLQGVASAGEVIVRLLEWTRMESEILAVADLDGS